MKKIISFGRGMVYIVVDTHSEALDDYMLSLYISLKSFHLRVTLISVKHVHFLCPTIILPNMLSCFSYIEENVKNSIIFFIQANLLFKSDSYKFNESNKLIYFNRDPYDRNCDRIMKLWRRGFFIMEYYKGNQEKFTEHLNKNAVKLECYRSYCIPHLYNRYDLLYNLNNNVIEKKYDIGMIFRFRQRVNHHNRREKFWKKLVKYGNFKSKLISSYGHERDVEILKCKIIINIRSKVSSYADNEETGLLDNRESLRIDRIIPTGVIVVSEPHEELVSYHDQFTIFSVMEEIIPTCKTILENYESKQKEIYSQYQIKGYEEESKTMMNEFMKELLDRS